MRLLTHNNRGELYVTPDLADDDIPPYAVLSHTWGSDEEEVKLNEIGIEACKSKTGYRKIEFCGQQAKRDRIHHFWVDTCCIDKTDHVELSEAITSMYRWYEHAQVCYVYLADVSSVQNNCSGTSHDVSYSSSSPRRSWKPSFRKSRWFTRGWTLQELLAPQQVVFYSKEGESLGTKRTLKDLLHEVTSIPVTALENQPLSQFTESERLRWAEGRTTKRKEDRAYCLLGILNVKMYLNYGERDHAFVRLTEAINKIPRISISLRVVDGAAFNAYGQDNQGCHPATRVDLLQSVRNWARDTKGKNIFWLSGVAGTGKSTISWTVARWLADQGTRDTAALGASFFFKRGEGERASAALFFPTIATQLATSIKTFDMFLAQAVKADPQICNKSLGEQFHRLICEPLQRIKSDTACTNYVVVVDALDECEDEREIRGILQLWSTLPDMNTIRLRLFLTSRPELVIRLGFKKMSAETHHNLILHEIPKPIIQHDILAFLTDALGAIRKDYNLLLGDDLVDEQLADDWPGGQALQELTTIAMPLFIVAATIHRLVRRADHPQNRLEMVLRSKSRAHLSEMGEIYLLILQAMTRSLQDEEEMLQVHGEFRKIVGTIVTLAEPLSRRALAALLDMRPGYVQVRLQSLHAVLEIPQDGDVSIRPLHLSFGEYITSEAMQKTPYWIDAEAAHAFLWRRCLTLLSSSLRENICHLEHPGQLLSDVPLVQIENHVPREVRYACRYWIHHVRQSGRDILDEEEVLSFLKDHFLHWLEVLSLMHQVSEAIGLLGALQSCVLTTTSDLSVFLMDARRFVLAHRYIIDRAPLQLYSSAIIFAPEESLVRKCCGQVPSWIRQYPRTPDQWSSELQKLEGHSSEVSAVAFSPDGGLLASGSYDGTIRLWDPQTGREVQKLEGHSGWVRAVAFSPDGGLLASGSSDKTIRLWDPQTGREVQKLEGHSGGVNTLAFSPDGCLLASGSDDETIRLWDTQTGQVIHRIWNFSVPHSIRFAKNNTTLITDKGSYAIDDGRILSTDEVESGKDWKFIMSDEWIRRGDQNLLWLPHEYRGILTCHSEKLAIGAESGLVSIFEFDPC